MNNSLIFLFILLVCSTVFALEPPDTIWITTDSAIEDNYMRSSGFITANYSTLQYASATSVNTAYFGLDATWKDTVLARASAGWVVTDAGIIIVADSVYTATRNMVYRCVLKPPPDEATFTGRDWDNSPGIGSELAWTTGLAGNYSTLYTGINSGDGTGYDASPIFDSVTITEYVLNYTDTINVPAEYVRDAYDNDRGWGVTAKQSASGGQVLWYSKENTVSTDYDPKFFIIMSSPLDVYGYEEVTIGLGGIEATGLYSLSPTSNYVSTNPLSIARTAFPQRDNVLIRPVDFTHLAIDSSTLGVCSLFVKGTATTPNTINFHICNQDWTEAGATYNKYDGTTDWSVAGGTDSSGTDIGVTIATASLNADQYYGVEIPLATAKLWIANNSSNGVLIRGTQTLIGTLNSDEATAANAPFFRFYPAEAEETQRRVYIIQ